VLTYLLVEFGEENGGELEIPDSVNLSELIAAANEIDVLSAPISSHGDDEDNASKYVAKDVVDKIRMFRNVVHPARALKESYDPRTFTVERLAEFKEMYRSVTQSLLHNL
jgi:hypothetical protein